MRALVVLCLCAGVSFAAPKYSHTPLASKAALVAAAERKWTIATASRGAAQSDLWEDAATAFVAIVDANQLPEADLALAARAALAALKNAMHVDPRVRDRPSTRLDVDFERVPIAVDVAPRDERMMRVLEVAARYEADPPERANLSFFRANIWRRYNRFDKAIPIYLDLVANHPTNEIAELGANLVLDAYNRFRRYDDLLAFAKKLLDDKAFLANRPDLAHTVNTIWAQGQGLVAREATELARATGERSYFEQCGEAYLAILDGGLRRKTDEVLYNAMICFQQAGNTERALATLRRLATEFPSSVLTKRGELQAISMLATIGRIDAAATAGERWLRTNTTEPDAPDILEDTIRWRVATGSLDHAIRIFDEYVRRARRLPQLAEHRAAVAVSLAAIVLDEAATKSGAGASRLRAVAVRLLARPPALTRTIDNDAASRIEVARVYAAAACPIALVDGLCMRRRDQTLMAPARRELARIPRPHDGVTLFLADLALEAILAKRAPTANIDADYRHLLASSDPDVRVASHARLAALAKHANDASNRTKHLEACLADAYVSRAGDTWRAFCDRELFGAHHVLPPARAPIVMELEAPPRSSAATPHAALRAISIDLD